MVEHQVIDLEVQVSIPGPEFSWNLKKTKENYNKNGYFGFVTSTALLIAFPT